MLYLKWRLTKSVARSQQFEAMCPLLPDEVIHQSLIRYSLFFFQLVVPMKLDKIRLQSRERPLVKKKDKHKNKKKEN